ncbi:MAG TPA: phosphate acyltransferase [Bacteroidales bacterium]|nr:phosphate butyryltransferase [Bacteroidales bacterium]HNZ43392.1 phosphate acyltransferase [Bacteroidales bacterium]HOH83224.1 phosphate acyltransferase [Bacteroidales bacterium]HPB26105.1 phosphate acyltransferase [Bacteroidales bacterium]HPI31383.1 phosphate acyltransferase [Bacteroidales bacterium]
MPITKLEQMFDLLKSKEKKQLVAAYANDSHTIGAVSQAVDMGLIEATLVGDTDTINKVCSEMNINPGKFTIVQEADEIKAAEKAVALINEGKGHILMKGLVSSDKYMRAILNKEKGLMSNPNAVLSHVTVIETPQYPKLLIVADVAIIPLPDLKQKIVMTNYLIKTAHALGIEKPKIAILAATEQMSAGMPACVDAAIIAKMADRGQIKGAIVDGPLALDVAVDKESCEIKKLNSPIHGDTDCILFPNIESGNVFFKTNTKLAGGELGAVVFGAKVPAVLTSRGDSEKTKLYSIALAACLAK